ncbi:MAG: response regulator transcription factor [Candidatus Eremiobacteraeota bacterium]|nr:response regulator transcription factor [Candidatus Eremiobacteraeota bacterium]
MIAALPQMDTQKLSLIIVEQQALFAKALSMALGAEPSFHVVCDAESIQAAPLRMSRPDLVLLDLDNSASDLAQTIRTCREILPRVRICVLSSHAAPELMQRCISAGADGFVLKDVSPSELIRALKIVATGAPYVDPRVAGGVLQRRFTSDRRTRMNELSSRETDIIRLIAKGLSNKEIGSNLSVSEKTVKNHISRIFSKLNINARTQAAVHAIKVGLA